MDANGIIPAYAERGILAGSQTTAWETGDSEMGFPLRLASRARADTSFWIRTGKHTDEFAAKGIFSGIANAVWLDRVQVGRRRKVEELQEYVARELTARASGLLQRLPRA